MSAPVVVSDLEMLSRTSLYCEDEPSWKRVAYYAGLLSSLSLAKKLVEVTDVIDTRLYPVLMGISHPLPEVREIVALIRECTVPQVSVDLTIFSEPGLRFGDPGPYYFAGMTDGLHVAVVQVPQLFKYLYEDSWRVQAMAWIDSKIDDAKADLDREKRLVR